MMISLSSSVIVMLSDDDAVSDLSLEDNSTYIYIYAPNCNDKYKLNRTGYNKKCSCFKMIDSI